MLGTRWGVSDAETAMKFPCDEAVPDPSWAAWRGVSVSRPPEAVWPWICQLRLAPYSYDWIDNLGRRSPRDLQGLPSPSVGERFSRSGGRAIGRVVGVEPGVSLTATIMGVHMSYLLVPNGASQTRLLLKIVASRRRLYDAPLVLGDLVMARKQLLTLKRLAEALD